MMESKRKSFFLLLLVLGLFTAGAYFFSAPDDMVYEEQENTTEEEEEQPVAAVVAEEDFFARYRISREQRRDEAEELYRGILLDSSRDETAKQEAEAALAELYRVASLEDRVEEILIGRNYRDVIFVMEDTISLLMIDQSTLDEAEKADLIAFVSAYAGIAAESLSVFTVD